MDTVPWLRRHSVSSVIENAQLSTFQTCQTVTQSHCVVETRLTHPPASLLHPSSLTQQEAHKVAAERVCMWRCSGVGPVELSKALFSADGAHRC